MTDKELAAAYAQACLNAGDDLVIHTFERAIRDVRESCAERLEGHDESGEWFRQCLQAIADDGCQRLADGVACKDDTKGGGISFKHWCHACQAAEWLKGPPAEISASL